MLQQIGLVAVALVAQAADVTRFLPLVHFHMFLQIALLRESQETNPTSVRFDPFVQQLMLLHVALLSKLPLAILARERSFPRVDPFVFT